MAQDRKVKEFTLHLRRQLYLMQLLQYTNSCITEMSITPTFLKVGTNNLNNSIKRIISDLKVKGDKGAWNAINEDLNKDQLHDISLLIDEVANVENVEVILNAVRVVKEECYTVKTEQPCLNN